MLGLLLGLALFTLGAWEGIHIVRLRTQGRAAMALVLRVEEYTSGSGRNRRTHYRTVMGIDGTECVAQGDLGHRGQMIAVHHAVGHREDCIVDSPRAHRGTLIFLVAGIVVLAGAFAAYRRAAR
jgi:hypothetical protein